MPLTLPNLDDRTYANLAAEARALIPTYAPEWTNHNPSDPGITLLELFAYVTELLIYRVNRVTDANVVAFLRLINGPSWTPTPGRSLTEDVRDAVLQLRRPYRAVTSDDFESLVLAAGLGVARAHCMPRRELDSENELAHALDRPGHVSLIILPVSADVLPMPSAQLRQDVATFLDTRRLLTTRVHVVGPQYLGVKVRLTLVLKPDAVPTNIRSQSVAALRAFLDPLRGGPDHDGWPFGRSIYTSEIYELLDSQPGVDYVMQSSDQAGSPLPEVEPVPNDPSRVRLNGRGETEAVELRPNELVASQVEEADITTVPPVGQ
jgi:baseplate J-like protein